MKQGPRCWWCVAYRMVLVEVSVAMVVAVTPMQTFAAQPSSGALAQSGNPACNILTPEDLRTITGFPGYKRPSPGDAGGQGAGGGASCQYQSTGPTVDARGNVINEKGPLLSLVLISGKNYTKTMAIGRGCKKEVVSGVGDEAFFEVCPSTGKLSRTAPLYVKSGMKDLIVQIDIESPDTDATIRPKVIAVAKAAAMKVR